MHATTHIFYSYTIDNHPNPDQVFDWIRNNWHDLGQFAVDEALDSLRGFADHFGCSLDYSISIVPDRGEYITLKPNDDAADLSGVRLLKYITNNYDTYWDKYHNKTADLLAGNCPFTGTVYDEILLDEIRGFMSRPDNRTFSDLLTDCGNKLLSDLHDEGEYIYSDEGLREYCKPNGWEFYENGEIAL